MAETRRLAAILAADVVGFSRLAGADEDRTLARLRALRSDLIDPTIAVHHGRVVKRTGDGAIVEFRSVVDAVLAAGYGWLGREAEARAELAEALKLSPGATVKGVIAYASTVSDNPVLLQQNVRRAEGLRKAGLPEQ
jgi:class 3 adenylate cyclase